VNGSDVANGIPDVFGARLDHDFSANGSPLTVPPPVSLERAREPILENLALAPGGLAKAPGRHAAGPMEGPREIGEVGEPDLEGDVGDRPPIVGEEALGVAQTAADDVLVRGHAEHAGEDAQEVERAEPCCACGSSGLRCAGLGVMARERGRGEWARRRGGR
jgi:hypothetical protein